MGGCKNVIKDASNDALDNDEDDNKRVTIAAEISKETFGYRASENDKTSICLNKSHSRFRAELEARGINNQKQEAATRRMMRHGRHTNAPPQN